MAVEKVNIENIALTKEIFGNLDKNTKKSRGRIWCKYKPR